jgi:hypothetical protein
MSLLNLGINRIQTAYNLKWNDIFRGEINGKVSRHLTVDEILDIVQTIKPDSESGLSAFKHALTFLANINSGLYAKIDQENHIDKLEFMSKTLVTKKCLCSRESIHIYNILNSKNNTYAKKISSALNSCIRTFSVHDCKHMKLAVHSQEGVNSNVLYLCTEAILKSPVIKTRKRNLHCKLVHNNKAALIINPVKVEIISDRPRLAILHHIVRADKTLDSIRRIVKEQSSSYVTKKIYVEDGKAVAFIDIDLSHVTSYKLIEQKILALSTTKDLISFRARAINYGIGGFGINDASDQQVNYFERECIFSAVFQLTNVDDGGFEIFQKLGLTVRLEKGSALLYENMFRDGSEYISNEHCNCPVLHGNKWIVKINLSIR